jgi:hypothetical protein
LNNTGNIRGSFVAVLQEFQNNQVVNTVTAQGQLVGSVANANISLTSANVSITSSNGNSVGNFGLFLNGPANTGPTLGITYSDFTSGSIDSYVATASSINNIPGINTLTGTNVSFTRVPPLTTINYNYTITITIN